MLEREWTQLNLSLVSRHFCLSSVINIAPSAPIFNTLCEWLTRTDNRTNMEIIDSLIMHTWHRIFPISYPSDKLLPVSLPVKIKLRCICFTVVKACLLKVHVFGWVSHPTQVILLSPQVKWYVLIWFKY